MNIYLVSDIHFEFDQEFILSDLPFDLIVLAGDIHQGYASAAIAREFQRDAQVPVILVAGNHEFYHGDWNGTLVEIRKEAQRSLNVHFLEQNTVTIDNVRFLGCTLWSNFEINGAEIAAYHQDQARAGIMDFKLITNDRQPLKPADMVNRFRQSYNWLDAELSKPFDGNTVVVTHFGPHRAAIHPRYLASGMDALTPYFVSDCSALMERHRIAAWLYGHSHNSVDVIVDNGTRLVANAMGYPKEDPNYVKFNPRKIITI
jgi:predicted phosphodiesterase